MKKYAIILLVLSTILSCQKEVEFNDPAFEGLRNGQALWRAESYSVSYGDDDFLTISGSDGSGELSFTIPGGSVGTYTLGALDKVNATYEEDGVFYSTIYDGIGGLAQKSDGEIEIVEVDFVNKTFTGSFAFNAYNANGDQVVNFSGYTGDR